MTQRARAIILLLLGAALVALLLLSMSLTDLQLQPGSPFPGASGNAADPGASTATSGSQGSVAVLEAVLGVILLAILVYVPTRLARVISLRNILWLGIGFLLLVALLAVLPRVVPGPAVLLAEETTTVATPPSSDYAVSPLGDPPSAFQWLSAAGVLLAVALVAVLLVRQASKPARAATAVGQEAARALDDLRAGEAFRSVIIRCYLQMTDVLQREQKIERRQSMTAREFQEWLEAKGIPAAPVQRLTALFEAVRYGNGPLAPAEEQAGIDCLQQITEFCRAAGEAK